MKRFARKKATQTNEIIEFPVKKKTGNRNSTKKDDGFDSNLERRIAKTLPDTAQREGIKITYVIEKKTLPDWYFKEQKYFVEAKGYMDSSERTKIRAINAAVQKDYPGHTYLLVLSNPKSLTVKTGKMTYGDWATKYGITWVSEEDFHKEYKDILNLK